MTRDTCERSPALSHHRLHGQASPPFGGPPLIVASATGVVILWRSSRIMRCASLRVAAGLQFRVAVDLVMALVTAALRGIGSFLAMARPHAVRRAHRRSMASTLAVEGCTAAYAVGLVQSGGETHLPYRATAARRPRRLDCPLPHVAVRCLGREAGLAAR